MASKTEPSGVPTNMPELDGSEPGGVWSHIRYWPRRRWTAAVVTAMGTVAFVGLTTAMVPNPVFGRAVPTTWWAWPALIATSVLGGLLAATYVRGSSISEPVSKTGLAGGVLSYLAVGCPVCNKLVLLALGYTGALTWFAPAQPWLAIAGIVLLGYALRARLRSEVKCPA